MIFKYLEKCSRRDIRRHFISRKIVDVEQIENKAMSLVDIYMYNINSLDLDPVTGTLCNPEIDCFAIGRLFFIQILSESATV